MSKLIDFKSLRDSPVFKMATSRECNHGSFVIDNSLNYVRCGICGEQLNPMFVLERLAMKELRFKNRLQDLEDAAKKAELKNRCKCEHCGKMTVIVK